MTDAAPTEPRISLLIASNRVDEIKVRSRDGDAIGNIHTLMINKRTGQTAYAVLSLGGFLGLGRSYYPLPFQLLAYDHAGGGYVVTIDRRMLEGGPSWSNNAPEVDQAYADRVSSYYGVAAADVTN